MEVTFDSLSFVLLALVLTVSLLHLFLLRKPEPATHPLLLGRQSDLARVSKQSAFLAMPASLTHLSTYYVQTPSSPPHLSQVRKVNESPAFVSSSAGLGGTAKHSLQNVDSVQSLWKGAGSKIVTGINCKEESLEAKVAGLAQQLQPAGTGVSQALAIKVDEPTGTFLGFCC